MPSLIPGFEYDIFISYRQKDNKGDHWVTGFVNVLKTELEATFKEDISIYFDENPHDGLHENHDVDDSLKEKLKCLVFIPILSRTYCDPKCFAFEHEFKAFVEQASRDSFGVKVKLPGGNVATRLLSVRIHELDKEDVKQYENISGSVLRSIDFVFQSAGVNRPLTSSDKREENINRTFYKDQINKVANAIRELVVGMQKPALEKGAAQQPRGIEQVSKRPSNKKKLLGAAAIAVLIALAAWIGYNYFSPKLETEGAGIAVIPFRNLTGNETRNDFGVGIASEVSNKLALTKTFDFISALQATLGYQNSTALPKTIGEELKVDYILTGFYQADGETIQITTELTKASDGKRIWSLPYRSSYSDIFDLQNKIAARVMERFSMTVQLDAKPPTENLEAYTSYLGGLRIITSVTYGSPAYFKAIPYFERAIELDSNFLSAYVPLANAYGIFYRGRNSSTSLQSFKVCLDYAMRHFPPSWERNMIEGHYANFALGDYDRGIKLYTLASLENSSIVTPLIGIHRRMLQHRDALNEGLRILKQNPIYINYWNQTAFVLLDNGDLESAEWVLRKVYDLDPLSYDLLYACKLLQNRIEELPGKLKESSKFYRADFLLQKRSFARVIQYVDSVLLDSVFTINHRNRYRAVSIYLLNQDDSSKRIARTLNQMSSEAIVSVLKYGLLCDEKGLDERVSSLHSRFNLQKDLATVWSLKRDKFTYYAFCKDYVKADSLLRRMNREYPQIGGYGWLYLPMYDRIKREYPPINETIRNLKYPPKAMDENLKKEFAKLM